MFSVKVEYEVEVRDKDGKLLKREKGESRSLLKNFMACLRALMIAAVNTTANVVTTGGAEETVKDVSGADQTIWGGWRADTIYGGGWPMAINAPDDDDSHGIVVGVGDTPVSPEDYKLAGKIAHGSGSGQLDYGTHSFEAIVVEDKVSKFRVSRTFTNISGASVTVKEIGIIAWCYYRNNAAVKKDVKFLIVRDVLITPTTIPDGASLNVRYTFSVEA